MGSWLSGSFGSWNQTDPIKQVPYIIPYGPKFHIKQLLNSKNLFFKYIWADRDILSILSIFNPDFELIQN